MSREEDGFSSSVLCLENGVRGGDIGGWGAEGEEVRKGWSRGQELEGDLTCPGRSRRYFSVSLNGSWDVRGHRKRGGLLTPVAFLQVSFG